MDFFTGLFPEAVQNVIEQIGRIFMGIFFAIVTYETCRMAIANVNIKSSAMQIPMAVPYFIMAFGCAGITLESLINFVLYAKGLKKKNKNTEEDLLS